MIVTKKDILKRIAQHCRKECKSESEKECFFCSLSAFKSGKVEDQTDLFKICDSHLFYQNVIDAANEFEGRPFWWSELRAKVGVPPVVDNWWPVASWKLRAAGFRIIGSGRRSTFESRCGAIERRWQKVVV